MALYQAGNITGMTKLLEDSWTTAVTSYDFALPSTFNDFMIIFNWIPVNDSSSMDLRFSSDGGSTFLGTSIYHFEEQSSSSSSYSNNNATDGIRIAGGVSGQAIGNQSDEGAVVQLWINNTQNTTTPLTTWAAIRIFTGVAAPASNFSGGGLIYNQQATTVNYGRFLASSGNITSGTVKVYAVNK